MEGPARGSRAFLLMSTFTDILTEDGQIHPDKVEDLLIEVTTGKCIFTQTQHPFDLYACRSPVPHEQDKGRIVYSRALHDAQKMGLKSRAELLEFAQKRHLFDPNEQIDKNNQRILIEKWSKARQITSSPEQKLELDANLMKAHSKIAAIEVKEDELLRNCRESYAESQRISFYVSCCTLGGEMLDMPVWHSWDEFQQSTEDELILDATTAFMRVSAGLPIKIIRALARTRAWRDRWKASKESHSQPFEGIAGSWDKNKVSLVYWSDFYDSVYQHPECPPEEVVNNDDYLQDWLNQQIAKRKQAATQRPGKSPVVTRGGKPMQKVGESHRKINTPVRVRT
jgi:hypothetical protein